MKSRGYYANGKLLLSGEYLVMKGAASLAVPLRSGQSLMVNPGLDESTLRWQSKEYGQLWFESRFSLPSLEIIGTSDSTIALKLTRILNAAIELNPQFRQLLSGKSVVTDLGFNRQWGFGSSSTLVYNIASWAGVDPYALYADTFGGSGYDIAAAGSGTPLIYKLLNGNRLVEESGFRPGFAACIYFAYSGLKRSTAESIRDFESLARESHLPVDEVSGISYAMAGATKLEEFSSLMREHEHLLSTVLRQPSVRETRFKDLEGEVKSLGAWGGDFYMITFEKGREALAVYLASKKIDTFFGYDELVLS